MSDPHFVSQPFPPTLPTGISRKRLLLASFFSALLPGTGHFLVNRRSKGVVWLLLFCVLLLLHWPLRLPGYFWPLALMAPAMTVLFVFAVWDAPYAGKHRSDKLSQWWLVLLLPLSFLGSSAHNYWSLRASGFQFFSMPSRSMENTVALGNHVVVDRWYYRKRAPVRGDIIIYVNKDGIYFMKRVIAVGGEIIEGKQGTILIGGKLLQEPYVIHMYPASPEGKNFGPMIVPSGKLFVMGDNRDVSLDSRMPEIGPIDTAAVRGKPLYTLPLYDNSQKTLK